MHNRVPQCAGPDNTGPGAGSLSGIGAGGDTPITVFTEDAPTAPTAKTAAAIPPLPCPDPGYGFSDPPSV
jgi:hypothetical protein